MEPEVPDRGIVRHKVADRIRPVVNDDEFAVRVSLQPEVLDRVRHELPPIERRHHTRDERVSVISCHLR